MDKINKYKKIVEEFATYIASISPSDESVETQFITDDKHGHYLLFSVGWANTYREYSPFVHIDVKPDGKVWIQHDGTDLKIALLLVEKGIPKKDIVIGFRNIEQRQHLTEFAVS